MNHTYSEKDQVYIDHDYNPKNSATPIGVTIYAIFFSVMGIIVVIALIYRICRSAHPTAPVVPVGDANQANSERIEEADSQEHNTTLDRPELDEENPHVIISMETPRLNGSESPIILSNR